MVVCAISWNVVTVFEEKSRAALHYNLWVRQVVISWLDTQWWYLMMMMMANSLELLVQVEHSAPPSSSSTCQISTVSIIILFCLKLWLIKAFAFFVFFSCYNSEILISRRGGSNWAAQITIYNGSFQTKWLHFRWWKQWSVMNYSCIG